MRVLMIICCIANSLLLPVEQDCKVCGNHHENGVCEKTDCECNYYLQIAPLGKEWPKD